MKLPVGIPIIRWNSLLSQWQRFTTTVEARYPENEVEELIVHRITPLNIHAQFLGVESSDDDTVQIAIPNKLYTSIIVVKRYMERVSDWFDVDWINILEGARKYSDKHNKPILISSQECWKHEYLNEILELPLSKSPFIDFTEEETMRKRKNFVDGFTYTHSLIMEKNARFISSIAVS